MDWRVKAALLGAVSRLPSSVSYGTYYWLQRNLGRSQVVDVVTKLRHGVATWTRAVAQGQDPRGKVFFEVGSGRTLLVPLSYWLMGAQRTVSIDLNRYLSRDMVGESLRQISSDADRIRGLFGDLLDAGRFDALLAFGRRHDWTLDAFLDLCQIEYIAPGDAADTGVPSGSIDIHTSYTVFEHIPPEILRRILAEGNRITSETGMFVHRIDYSDHFYTFDEAISAINFLQYSDRAWRFYAGNRFAYTNRLRHDDILRIFEEAGHCLVDVQPDIDRRALEVLQRGTFRLDERFTRKSNDVLSISASWIVSAKRWPPVGRRRPSASVVTTSSQQASRLCESTSTA